MRVAAALARMRRSIPAMAPGMNLMDLASNALVAGRARRDRAGSSRRSCRRFGRRGRARAACRRTGRSATAFPPAAIVPLVGRQSVQPGRHRRDSSGHSRRLAGHERHGVCVHAASRAAAVARVSITDRRFHEPGVLSQRLAGPRVDPVRASPRLGHLRAPARTAAGQRRLHHAAVARTGNHAARAARRGQAVRLRSVRCRQERARTRRRPDDGDGQSRRWRSPANRSIASSPPAAPPPTAPSCR